MSTMRDICTGAMRRLGLIPLDQTPEANELAEYLTALNGMMFAWKNEGVDIGHTEKDLNDTFPLGPEYDDGVKAMLAVRIADENGKEVKPATALHAHQCWVQLQAEYIYDTTLKAGFDPVLTRMPSQRRLVS